MFRRLTLLASFVAACASSPLLAQAPTLPPLPDSISSAFGPIAVVREAPTSCPQERLGCFNRLTRVLIVDTRLEGIMAWRVLEHERVHVSLWDANLGFANEEQEDRFAHVIANARVAQMIAELQHRLSSVQQVGAPLTLPRAP